jgi:hypothetical protein
MLYAPPGGWLEQDPEPATVSGDRDLMPIPLQVKLALSEKATWRWPATSKARTRTPTSARSLYWPEM